MPRILIVEDQPDIRKLIRMTLEFGNYELHEAENGQDGWLKAQGLRPDLVLLDVMMPGELDGFQVCRKVKGDRELGTRTRVVMLTARGQKSDLEQGAQAGADAYLVKPFSPLELVDKVDDLLAARVANAG
ncbi:MAG TPA: response regulator [Usitatibacteraceae bacterium]|nr:response regulator [Usitatibacteraceae bacterium]